MDSILFPGEKNKGSKSNWLQFETEGEIKRLKCQLCPRLTRYTVKVLIIILGLN